MDQLSRTFAALSDPTRRAILKRLSDGPTTVGELARPFEISLPAVSRHLKVLEHSGLIRREAAAQWRLCRLSPEPLRAAAGWLETYREFWSNQLDALERYLERPEAPGERPQSDTQKNRGDKT